MPFRFIAPTKPSVADPYSSVPLRNRWSALVLLVVGLLLVGCSLHTLPPSSPQDRAVDRYEDSMNLASSSASNFAGQVSDLGPVLSSKDRLALIAPYLNDLSQAQQMLTDYRWPASVRTSVVGLIDSIGAYRLTLSEDPYIQGMKMNAADLQATDVHIAAMSRALEDLYIADSSVRSQLHLKNYPTRCAGGTALVPWPAMCSF